MSRSDQPPRAADDVTRDAAALTAPIRAPETTPSAASAIENHEPVADVATGQLLDFDIAEISDWGWKKVLKVILFSMLLGLGIFTLILAYLVVIVPLIRPFGRVLGTALVLSPILLLVTSIILIVRLVSRRSAQKLETLITAADFEDRRAALMVLFRQMFRGLFFGRHSRLQLTLVLGRALAKRGLQDLTIRIAPRENLGGIVPLQHTIEARLLNESQPDFFELHSAAVPDEPRLLIAAKQSLRKRISAALRPRPPQLRADGRRRATNPFVRNFVLNGGWILFMVFGAQSIGAIIESLRIGRPTPMLYFWAALLTMSVVVPVHSLRRLRRQWLVTSGGVILRHTSWRDPGWKLHIFDRRSSVLIVRQLASAGQWWISMADATRSDQTVMTHAESQVLLAAWLSPLPPPPIERLSDLLQ